MIVLKLGGAALKATLSSPELFAAIAGCRQPLVIVHGGGPEINKLCEDRGLTFSFVGGQRVTTPEVMECVEMVLTGKINPSLVRGLLAAGRSAEGLSGVSGAMLECEEENPALGLVGRPVRSNVSAIRSVIERGGIPVVSPVGLLPGSKPCNVNADLATARLAADLRAERLLFLTDKDGILDAGGSPIAELSVDSLKELVRSETVSGGMKVKARAILETLAANPDCRVEVMNGLEPAVLASALTGGTRGTRIR